MQLRLSKREWTPITTKGREKKPKVEWKLLFVDRLFVRRKSFRRLATEFWLWLYGNFVVPRKSSSHASTRQSIFLMHDADALKIEVYCLPTAKSRPWRRESSMKAKMWDGNCEWCFKMGTAYHYCSECHRCTRPVFTKTDHRMDPAFVTTYFQPMGTMGDLEINTTLYWVIISRS